MRTLCLKPPYQKSLKRKLQPFFENQNVENLEKRQIIQTKTTSENSCNSDSIDDNVNSVNSSSSFDDEQFSKIKGKRYSKLACYKLYNGPKKYLPGQEFQYEFSGPVIDPESQAVLQKILKNKTKTIKSKIDKLSSKKTSHSDLHKSQAILVYSGNVYSKETK